MQQQTPASPALLQELGDALYSALRERRTLAPLSERYALSVEDAYRISLRFLARRESDGERVIGKKIGVTSKPVQDMLGVHQPDFGFLTDAMQYENGASVSLRASGLMQPRAEGEIAFMLKHDLQGPGVTAADVLAAKGIKVYRTFVGEYMTSLEMEGFSVSLLRLDDELKALLDAPADTIAFKA